LEAKDTGLRCGGRGKSEIYPQPCGNVWGNHVMKIGLLGLEEFTNNGYMVVFMIEHTYILKMGY